MDDDFDDRADLVAADETIRRLREENARLKAKLAKVAMELENILGMSEAAELHAYSTCDFGDMTNADRGCSWCIARASLAAAKGE